MESQLATAGSKIVGVYETTAPKGQMSSGIRALDQLIHPKIVSQCCWRRSRTGKKPWLVNIQWHTWVFRHYFSALIAWQCKTLAEIP
jgi:hypothetical protein